MKNEAFRYKSYREVDKYRGASRTAATFKMERFLIIVNGLLQQSRFASEFTLTMWFITKSFVFKIIFITFNNYLVIYLFILTWQILILLNCKAPTFKLPIFLFQALGWLTVGNVLMLVFFNRYCKHYWIIVVLSV